MSLRYTGGVQLQRGISVHRGDIMINVGEGHWENNWIVWKPQCTEHPLVYSWYPPHSSWYLPVYSWYLPSVLNTPQCTHDIPPVYWKRPWCTQWYPSSVLNTPGVLNDIPPVYWTSPVYLMISLPVSLMISPQCTAQTLCRVIIWLW